MEHGIGILIAIVIALIALFIFMFILQWVWNMVMPDVFGLKKITIWQALGLLILASILFGGHRIVNIYNPPPPYHAGPAMPAPL